MKEIVLVSKRAERDKDLLAMVQILFPECRSRIVYRGEMEIREPERQGEEDVKYCKRG